MPGHNGGSLRKVNMFFFCMDDIQEILITSKHFVPFFNLWQLENKDKDDMQPNFKSLIFCPGITQRPIFSHFFLEKKVGWKSYLSL